jgi:cytoskeletal protein CcmA (bactofilin family)
MRFVTAILLATLASSGAVAQETSMTLGGDTYAAGSNVTVAAPSPRDLFLAGASVEVGGDVGADAHVAGFDVDIEAPVAGDLYAGGFSVDVAAPVGTDVTAAAANFTLRQAATVTGNVRVFAADSTFDGPIAGSLLAAGGSLELNGTVGGDAVLTAGKLSFGPDARIDGTLTYYAQEPMQIPASVAAPERVRFEKLEPSEAYKRIPIDMPVRSFWPAFLSLFGAFVMTIAFLVLVGALALAFAPQATERLRLEAAERPFTSMLLGALGLSMLLGLVPVSGMTLFGIPLIPVVILAIVLAWIAGYLLGVYIVAWRLAVAFGAEPAGMAARLVVLALGLVVFALLNFVPFLGWLANLLVIFLGLGAFMKRGAVAVARGTAAPVPAI